MTTYLTADTHFGHPLMLTACNRPYKNVHEMNRGLIDNWNAVVNPEDTVWHLGDFAMKSDAREIAEIFYALNGRKNLIIGNHDVYKDGTVLPALQRLNWESISHAAEIHHDGNRIMLSHYAGWTWNQAHRGAYQAFGHTHGQMIGLPGSIDVGVDAQGLKPISAEEFVRQAEDSILNAKQQVDDNVGRLANLLDFYAERADVIRKKRGEERTRGFRR
jgi:calcineurin-like phosphoesterase family protein